MDAIRVDEFWSKIDRRGPDECWEWTGTRWFGGYGRAQSYFKAHRVSYEIAYGPIPKGMFVRHKCDNPPCCNPAHLLAGTPGDNMRDKRERGRAGKCWGEQHGNAVLTDEQCEDIRTRNDKGENCVSIARSYPHVSYGSVWTIAKRKTRANGSKRTGPLVEQST